MNKIILSAINYDEANFSEINFEKPEDSLAYKNKPGISWINADGELKAEHIIKIGEAFDIHHLVIEDIIKKNIRPKLEEFEKYLFMVFNMFYLDASGKSVVYEKVSLIFGENFLLTFQDRPGDVFDSIRNNLRNKKGRIRKMGSDYLAYSLMNAVIDNYFIVLENLTEQIDMLEDELLNNPTPKTLHQIHNLRNEMLFMLKSVWPVRELLDHIIHEESNLITEYTIIYFRDLYQHVLQIMEQLEISRDIISGMLDIYLSSISNKLNSIVKRLTLITTIFMPLSVLAGIGGMSEWSMMTGPENWKISYPIFILLSLLIGVTTYYYLKWKKLT